MSDLRNKIKQQQILSGEQAVIEGLKTKGLVQSSEPKKEQQFFKMQHFPDKVKNEEHSKTVLIFDEDDNSFADLGFYDFEKSEWVVLGDMSFKMICWCYIPNPSEFLKTKDYKSDVHRGYC